jgi:hypothetical protein
MSDLARLQFTVDSKQTDAASQSLDRMSTNAGKAAKATDALNNSAGKATSATSSLHRQVEQAVKVAQELQRAEVGLVAANDAVSASATRAAMAQQRMAASAKLQSYELMNLGRQLNDVATMAAMGANPMMILASQGGQVVQIFGDAASRGVGLKAALLGVGQAAVTTVSKFAPLIAMSAGLGLLAYGLIKVYEEARKTAEAEQALKDATAAANSEIATANNAMSETSVLAHRMGDESLSAALGIKTFAGEVGTAATKLYDMAAAAKLATINGLMAQRAALSTKIGDIESRMPDARRQAMNTPQKSIQGNVDAIARFFSGEFANIYTGGASDRRLTQELNAAKQAMKDLEQATKEAIKTDVKGWADEGRAALAAASGATRDHTRAMKDQKKAADDMTPAMKELAAYYRDLYSVHGMKLDLLPQITPTITPKVDLKPLDAAKIEVKRSTDQIIDDVQDAIDRVDGLTNSFMGVYYALRNNDWTAAASGLLRAIQQIRAAQASGGTGAAVGTGVSAIAGTGALGSGAAIGSTLGTVAGSLFPTLGTSIATALGGAALGATLGSAVLPVIGTAVGALIGSLFGGGSAKKKAQQQAEEDARQREADRKAQITQARQQQEVMILQLQGDAVGALALQRQYELASMDESLRANQQRIYQLQDEAEAAAKAANIATTARGVEIDTLDALGLSSQATAMRRQDELDALAKLDPSLVVLKQHFYDVQDAATAAAAALETANDNLRTAQDGLASAKQDLTDAYNREASAIQATRDKFQGLADSLRSFRETLSPSAGTSGEFFSLARAARLGDADAMAKLPQDGPQQVDLIKANAKTELEAARGIAQVRAAVQAAEDTARRQVSVADQQLAELQAQVGMLVQINTSVLTVAQAINNLAVATAAVQSATAGVSVASAGPNSGVTQTGNVLSWSGHNVDLTQVAPWIARNLINSAPGGAAEVEGAAVDAMRSIGMTLPGYASGGMHRGGLRIVGENGPEIEATGPSRLWSAEQTAGMLGGDNADLVAELRAILGELREITKEAKRGATLADRIWYLLGKVTLGGSAVRTVEVPASEAA